MNTSRFKNNGTLSEISLSKYLSPKQQRKSQLPVVDSSSLSFREFKTKILMWISGNKHIVYKDCHFFKKNMQCLIHKLYPLLSIMRIN